MNDLDFTVDSSVPLSHCMSLYSQMKHCCAVSPVLGHYWPPMAVVVNLLKFESGEIMTETHKNSSDCEGSFASIIVVRYISLY